MSTLTSLSIGPAWMEETSPTEKYANYEGESDRRGRGGPRRDRRPRRDGEGGRGPGRGGEGPGGGGRRDRRQRRDGSPQGRGGNRPPAPFRPVVEVTFYPEEAPFQALTKAIRTSCRTFELFEIGRLILEKNDRFAVQLRPRENDQEITGFYISVPDGLPFEREDEAVSHVLSQHLDKFFTIEEVEVEPPKGNFQMVNRCTLTGELLGPPNYHRYQALVQEHYAQNIGNMPFARYQQKIESVTDPEVVQQWVDKMARQRRYLAFGSEADGDGESPSFDSLESARFHLLTNLKEKVVTAAPTARFPGKAVEQMPPRSRLRRSVEAALEQQRRFPLDTANHLRGRLRRMGFTVYKKGAKGISFVCGVKRQFREEGQEFAESIQNLIAFLEDHPYMPVKDLPHEYLGIDTEALEKARQEGTEEAKEAAKPSPEEEAQLSDLRRDLRWLVMEGYVTEYSNGTLFAPPPRPGAKKPKEVPPAARQDAKPATGEKGSPAKTTAAPEAQEATATPESSAAPAPEAPAPAPEAPAPASSTAESTAPTASSVAGTAGNDAGPATEPPAASSGNRGEAVLPPAEQDAPSPPAPTSPPESPVAPTPPNEPPSDHREAASEAAPPVETPAQTPPAPSARPEGASEASADSAAEAPPPPPPRAEPPSPPPADVSAEAAKTVPGADVEAPAAETEADDDAKSDGETKPDDDEGRKAPPEDSAKPPS